MCIYCILYLHYLYWLLGLNLLDPVSCRGLFALFALGFMLWSLPGRHIRPLLLCINQSINQSLDSDAHPPVGGVWSRRMHIGGAA